MKAKFEDEGLWMKKGNKTSFIGYVTDMNWEMKSETIDVSSLHERNIMVPNRILMPELTLTVKVSGTLSTDLFGAKLVLMEDKKKKLKKPEKIKEREFVNSLSELEFPVD